MKKLNTQVTIRSLIRGKNKRSLINSAMLYIKCIDDINLNDEKKKDIETRLTEALNNVITFAYPDNQGKVEIRISAYDGFLEIKVKDWGCGISDVKAAREPLFSTKYDHSGLGFTCMESFSDKLTVKSTPNKGTIVTIRFYL